MKGVWAVCLCLCVRVAIAAAGARPPHIVIVIADDMGWNDVSFHGSGQILTPNIDALAYQGVVLNRHYAQPSCSPSRAALLTGRYPAHTGVQEPFGSGKDSALPLNFTLLPEHLSRLGYQTHLVGKWHLGCHRSEYLPTHRGFKSHFGFWNGFIGYFDGIHLHQADYPGIDARRNDDGAWQEFVGRYSTDLFAEEATSIIRAHNVSEGPLFLQLALSAPHTGNKGAELQVRDLGDNEKQHFYISDLHRRLYAGMVRAVDDAVGAVVEALSSRQMLSNSIVIFSSDNGAPTHDPVNNYSNYGSNWPLRGMKMSCHDGGVRMAAALWSPLVARGRVFSQLMHMVDWLPTLYTAAGGSVEDLGQTDGVSQWEALKTADQNSTGPRTELLVDLNEDGNEALIRWPWKIVKAQQRVPEFNTHTGENGRGSEVPQYPVAEVIKSRAGQALQLKKSTYEILVLRALATMDKLCPLVVNNSAPDWPCDDHFCLFNLESDPCETQDVSKLHPDIVNNLTAALDGYREGLVPRVPSTFDPRANPKLWANYWAPWADSAANLPTCSLVTLLLTCCLLTR